MLCGGGLEAENVMGGWVGGCSGWVEVGWRE